MSNALLILVGVILVLVLIYWYGLRLDVCQWCQHCIKKLPANGRCPTCPHSTPVSGHTSANAAEIMTLLALARGTLHRLRGVVRENVATSSQIEEFVNSGDNRLVVISNLGPEDFVGDIMGGGLGKLKAAAISAASVDGQKKYIVLSLKSGKLSPMGAPTADFDSAIRYLEKLARENVGAERDNLVFLVDEDVPVPHDKIALPAEAQVEKCCGKRY